RLFCKDCWIMLVCGWQFERLSLLRLTTILTPPPVFVKQKPLPERGIFISLRMRSHFRPPKRRLAMADVQALRAFRYDLGRVGALGDVVAPPYDVIGPELQQALYERSSYNVIRLILGKESAADTEADNRYTRAARTLKGWLQDDILV